MPLTRNSTVGPNTLSSPAQGVALNRKQDILLALAFGCVYLAIMGGHIFTVDGLIVYRQATSLALDHSIHFPQPLHWGTDVTSNSKYGIGLSLLYVPDITLVHWLTGLQPVAGDGYPLLYDDRLPGNISSA